MTGDDVGNKRLCWNVGPRAAGDGMSTFCVKAKGHGGRCYFVRDHISRYSKPWHALQGDAKNCIACADPHEAGIGDCT